MLRRRLVTLVQTFIGVLSLTFVLLHLAPGDPAALRQGEGRGISPEALAAFRHDFGLDRPLPRRLAGWLGHALVLDFGHSLTDGRPVRDRLLEALPTTAALATLAVVFSYALALPLGWLFGLGRFRSLSVVFYLLHSMPLFALALLCVHLGAPYGKPLSLVVGALCLAAVLVIRIARIGEASISSALDSDYARTARAKGASQRTIFFRHLLPNTLLPLVTLLSLDLPILFSGSVIIEQIFGLRGLGLLAFDSVLNRDYAMLLGLAYISAAITLGAVFLSDLLYAALDPRLRHLVDDARARRTSEPA